MFALPEAKRVRRKDIFDSASDDSGSDEEGSQDPQAESALREKLHAQLSGLFGFSFAVDEPGARQHQADGEPQPGGAAPTAAQQEGEGEGEGGQPGEDTYAFRLFRDEAPTHTVVLTHDEDPAARGDGGFVVPSRPRSYYVAPAPSPEKVAEYHSVAVSAEYLLADAGRRHWGLEKPWRVIHLVAPGSAPAAEKTVGEGTEEKKRRTRRGKKHRILSRMREREVREREEAAKKKALEKEEHLQEKKKRLNRERKLKRRQKEREKKAESRLTDPGDGRPDDDSQKGGESG